MFSPSYRTGRGPHPKPSDQRHLPYSSTYSVSKRAVAPVPLSPRPYSPNPTHASIPRSRHHGPSQSSSFCVAAPGPAAPRAWRRRTRARRPLPPSHGRGAAPRLVEALGVVLARGSRSGGHPFRLGEGDRRRHLLTSIRDTSILVTCILLVTCIEKVVRRHLHNIRVGGPAFAIIPAA